MSDLYPEIEPYNEFMLKVSKLHTIHVEEVGNPNGKPAIFLHGGPGGGISPHYRRFFNPLKWRLILFSQRGCGKSTPFAELKENTTWDLVKDMEKIRTHLGIEKWLVFGGSWGSTLALAYAETYPKRVSALILRGIFLCQKKEINWLYQEGTNRLYPDFWEDFVAPIKKKDRKNMVRAYHKLLTHKDRKVRLNAAKAWSVWEARTSALIPDFDNINKFASDDELAEAFARIECHYFINKAFLKSETQLLKNAKKLKNIPGVIVHGRYDIVCPIEAAWELTKVWPEAKLEIVQDAGHSLREPGIAAKLVEYTERFASIC